MVGAYHVRQAISVNLVSKRRDVKLEHGQKQVKIIVLSVQQAISAKKLAKNQSLAKKLTSALKDPRKTKNE